MPGFALQNVRPVAYRDRMTLPLTNAGPFTDSPAIALFDLDLPDRWWRVTVTFPADQGRGPLLPGMPAAETAELGEEWRVAVPVEARDEAEAVAVVRARFAGYVVSEVSVRPIPGG